MAQIMIYEVCQFPDDIAVNYPIPGNCGCEQCIRLEKPNAKCNGSNGYKSRCKSIKYVNEEYDRIARFFKFFINYTNSIIRRRGIKGYMAALKPSKVNSGL